MRLESCQLRLCYRAVRLGLRGPHLLDIYLARAFLVSKHPGLLEYLDCEPRVPPLGRHLRDEVNRILVYAAVLEGQLGPLRDYVSQLVQRVLPEFDYVRSLERA